MNLGEMFTALDNAIADMNKKKDAYSEAETNTQKLYEDYRNAYKVADGVKAQLQQTLGNALPAQEPTRSIVR